MFNPYDSRQEREDRAAEQAAEDLDRATYTSLTLRNVQVVRSDDPLIFAELQCTACGVIGEVGEGETLDQIAYAAHLHVIGVHR